MAQKVVLFRLSRPKAREVIRACAANSAQVHFTDHANKQMKVRRITPMQVLKCLKTGAIIEGPAKSIHGNWECTVLGISAGMQIGIPLAIELSRERNEILIITAYFFF